MKKLEVKKGGKYITAEGELVTITVDMKEDKQLQSWNLKYSLIGNNYFNYNSIGENSASVHRKNIVREATLWDKVKRWFS